MKRKVMTSICLLLSISLVSAWPSKIYSFQKANSSLDRQLVEAILEQKGNPITFSYSNQYDAERRTVRQVTGIKSEEGFYGKMSRLPIGIGLIDLNDDGRNEIVALVKHPSYCGTKGCPVYFLAREKGDHWRIVCRVLADDDISVLTTKGNRYCDLRIRRKKVDPYRTIDFKLVLRFDGDHYRSWLTRERVCDYAGKKETTHTSIFDVRREEWIRIP